MDPEAALDRAEEALDTNEPISEAKDALREYAEWRKRGGFQPKGGDARAKRIDQRILATMEQRKHRPSVGPGRTASPSGSKFRGLGAAKETFADARARLLTELAALGWRVALRANTMKPLKTPHATSPDGNVRIDLHPQSAYVHECEHSIESDYRGVSASALVKSATEHAAWERKFAAQDAEDRAARGWRA